MKKRTRKLVSILLAAAMVFSMNTISFAEEVSLESADEIPGSAETADIAAFDADASLDEASSGEAALTGASLADAENPDRIVQGMTFSYDKDKDDYISKTDISYSKDSTNKKATIPDVVKITNVDNPVSWNNHYAAGLIHTVLFGSNNVTSWLNNNSAVTVSENYSSSVNVIESYAPIDGNDTDNDDNSKLYPAPKGYREPIDGMYYKVVPVKDGEAYLFVAYGLVSLPLGKNEIYYYDLLFVEGYDDNEAEQDGRTTPAGIPITEWDGRKIDYNKSGKYKWTTSKKESLDVKVALVKYENGTLSEIPGAEASVKVDQKNQKNASVTYDYQFTQKPFAVNLWDPGKNKYIPTSSTTVIYEYKKLSDLPFFTLSVKLKGKDAKAYKKELKTALKDEKDNKC